MTAEDRIDVPMDRFGGKITRHVALLAVGLVSIAVVSALFIMNRQGPARYFDGVARQAAVAIDHGALDELKTLVDQGLVIDERGREQMTLLWYAIIGKHYDATRQLVALGAKPDENGVSPLGSPLHHALTSDTELLKAFLDAGLTLDYRTASGTSLLQRSVFGDGAIDRVRLLVQRGADINHRDKLGGTALDEAIAVRKPEIAIFLVEQGADVDGVMTNGSTTAWAVQWMLGRLQHGSSSGTVTDITLSNPRSGPVGQTQVPIQNDNADTASLRVGFERLRAMMIAKGVKFPADPPDVVRARRKSQGLPVAE
ncbi:ankyrin repeat domain-containing protein [Neorhizobium sp. DT-125]|uniref:ankyrin repeat domain-containing protein n=1 Tax=Neorhizobium sp. DT-125 TaxID=3396163 RepID=UPI003F1CD84F